MQSEPGNPAPPQPLIGAAIAAARDAPHIAAFLIALAGSVLTAVADELILAHPVGPVTQAMIVTQCGGLIVFLIGTGLFKRPTSRLKNFPLSHSIGLALLAVQALWGWFILPETLAFAGVSIAILIVVTVWEWVSFHGGWRERLGLMASRWR